MGSTPSKAHVLGEQTLTKIDDIILHAPDYSTRESAHLDWGGRG